jgi:hypothetical protein
MTKTLAESRDILDGIIGTIVRERTDKSGQVHPEQPVTVEYLEAQAADQIRYYESYRL